MSIATRITNVIRRDLRGTQSPVAMLKYLIQNPIFIWRFAFVCGLVYAGMKGLEAWFGFPASVPLAMIASSGALPLLPPAPHAGGQEYPPGGINN